MTAKRILIVEDEKPIRDLIAFGLKRAGYEVREAEDCREVGRLYQLARMPLSFMCAPPDGGVRRP